MDIELSQGEIVYYNSEFLGNFFRIYCANGDSPLSDVNITVITKYSTKEFHYDYMPPNETFSLLVLSRNSEGVIIQTRYSKCKELIATDKSILGAMRVFYRDGDYLGTSYGIIPNYEVFYYLEEK